VAASSQIVSTFGDDSHSAASFIAGAWVFCGVIDNAEFTGFPKYLRNVFFVFATRHDSIVIRQQNKGCSPNGRSEAQLECSMSRVGNSSLKCRITGKLGQPKPPGLHRIIVLACLSVLITQQ